MFYLSPCGLGQGELGINGMCEGLGMIPSTIKNKTQDFQPSEYIFSVFCVKTHTSAVQHRQWLSKGKGLHNWPVCLINHFKKWIPFLLEKKNCHSMANHTPAFPSYLKNSGKQVTISAASLTFKISSENYNFGNVVPAIIQLFTH